MGIQARLCREASLRANALGIFIGRCVNLSPQRRPLRALPLQEAA